MNTLKIGMEFDNMIKLCEFIGWKYDYKHSNRLGKKLSQYIEFHRVNRNKIVIDNVINPEMPIVQFKPKNYDYIYKVGDIVDVNSGQVEILKQIKLHTKKCKRRGYVCKCLNDGYVFDVYEYNLQKGIGCACCNNKIVIRGINDINTTNPKLGSMLLNYEDGYSYTKCSGQKVDWRCPICNTIHRQIQISNVAKRGLGCWCGKSVSYPNKFMFWTLALLGVEFEKEKIFDWAKNKRYDFYIPSLSCIIEMHGNQHFNENYLFTRKPLQFQIDNDSIKRNMAINNGIIHYIEIDCKQSDFNYIKNNVLSSSLVSMINFDNIEWNSVKFKCDQKILENISSIWNSGNHDCRKIGEELKLDRGCVRNHVNTCRDLGLIEVDDLEIEKRRIKNVAKSYYQSQSKPLKCNENNLYFGSVSICKREMERLFNKKFCTGNILGTIIGKNSHHHNFTFSYISREEFNFMKTLYPDKCFGDYFIITKSA